MKTLNQGKIPDLVYSREELLRDVAMIGRMLDEQARDHEEFWRRVEAGWDKKGAGR